MRRFVSIAFTVTLAVGCSQAPTSRIQPPPTDPKKNLQQLLAMMSGSFDSSAQAQARPDQFRHIVLHMTPIWRERADGPWLYVEQAAAETADKPYRQRVYQLSARADGMLVSDVFALPGDPLRFAGAWQQPNLLNEITPADLKRRDGCAITLFPTATGFAGATNGNGCASDIRGAAYATSDVSISSGELRTWDRGFDKSGNQVWGATAGPYIFKRRGGA